MLRFKFPLTVLLLSLLILVFYQTVLAELPPDIVIAFTFEEETKEIVTDISGNGNDAELKGSEITKDGKYGSGLLLNGSSNAIVQDSPELNPTDKMSILAWVQVNAWGNWGRLCEKGIWPDFSYLMLLGDVQGKLGFCVKNNGAESNAYSDGGVFKVGTWHHWAGVYDGASLITYVDGEVVKQNAFAKPIDVIEDILAIGSTGAGGSKLNGIVDEFMISTEPMTQEQIKNAMDGIEAMNLAVSSKGKIATTWQNIKTY
jgi:hypothetical protein